MVCEKMLMLEGKFMDLFGVVVGKLSMMVRWLYLEFWC